jgi:small subunit ribosomal protein S4
MSTLNVGQRPTSSTLAPKGRASSGRASAPFHGAQGAKGESRVASRPKTGFVDQTSFLASNTRKQSLKINYGELREKQFFHIYQKALKYKGELVDNLVALLERRLDTVVLRMNFCPSQSWDAARQFISHGHIFVGGLGGSGRRTALRRAATSNQVLKDGSIVVVGPSASLGTTAPIFDRTRGDNGAAWLEVNHKILSGVFLWAPKPSEVSWVALQPTQKVIRKFYWL